jgi:WD40-like Beta Propeller Repeat
VERAAEHRRTRISRGVAFAIQAVLAVVIAAMSYRIGSTERAPLESERRNATKLVSIDSSGGIARSFDLRGRYISPRVAPDGNAVLLTRVMPGAATLWRLSLATGALAPLGPPDDRQRSAFAIPSPDGKHFIFSQWRENRGWPFTATFDQVAGRPFLSDVSMQKRFSVTPDDWSSDGGRIVLTRRNTRQTDLLISDAHRGPAYPLSRLPENAHAFDARFSPDGKWIVFTSDLTGRDEIYRVQLPAELTALPLDAREITRVSEDGGCSPEWGFNGDVLYISPGGELVSHSVAGARRVFQISRLGNARFQYRFGGYAVDRAHGVILVPLHDVANGSDGN